MLKKPFKGTSSQRRRLRKGRQSHKQEKEISGDSRKTPALRRGPFVGTKKPRKGEGNLLGGAAQEKGTNAARLTKNPLAPAEGKKEKSH